MIEPIRIVGPLNDERLRELFDSVAELFEDNVHRSLEGTQYLISSPGGDVGYMLAMFDMLRGQQATTIASGILQSCAAVLLQAGKIRKMTANSLLVFHEPTVNSATGEVDEAVWKIHDHLVQLVADRSGTALPEAMDLFDNTFINPKRALSLNLIDEIIELPIIPVYQKEVTDVTSDSN